MFNTLYRCLIANPPMQKFLYAPRADSRKNRAERKNNGGGSLATTQFPRARRRTFESPGQRWRLARSSRPRWRR
jgi:hypothetical protein